MDQVLARWFLDMGLLTLYAFWLMERGRIEFEKYSAPAEGVVIAIHERVMSGEGGRVSTEPEVRFTLADGRAIALVDQTAVNIPVSIGNRVPVRYMPNDPECERIELEQAQTLLLMGIVLGGIILVGLIGSFFTGRAMLRAVAARRAVPVA